MNKIEGYRITQTRPKESSSKEKYQSEMQSTEEGEDSQVDPADAWLKAAGRNKGHVYGLGAAQTLYFDNTTREPARRSTAFDQGLYSHMEQRNKYLEDRLEEERQQRMQETAELRQMMEEMQRNYNCNDMFRPSFRDLRDPPPDGSGGGGASTGLPVN